MAQDESEPEVWQKRPKMNEEQWNVYRRPILLVLNIGLIVVATTMVIVLLWHRLTWGLEEWIHEITFYNFWNGTYVIISAAILLGFTCVAGYYAIWNRSVCWLLLTCVMHGTIIMLLLVGSMAMVTDAFSTREVWLARMIIDMIDPTNYNNNSLKDRFLGSIYRIVRCCGADGYKDYTDRFDISPHESCVDIRHSGGIYYEEGCAHKFSVWLKAWAGCTTGISLIVICIEVLMITWCKQLLRILKKQQRNAKRKGAEKEKLLKASSVSTPIVTSGIIKESRSFDDFQSIPPSVPLRSSSRLAKSEFNISRMQQQQGMIAQTPQIWMPAIPIMFANQSNPTQFMMQGPLHQNGVHFQENYQQEPQRFEQPRNPNRRQFSEEKYLQPIKELHASGSSAETPPDPPRKNQNNHQEIPRMQQRASVSQSTSLSTAIVGDNHLDQKKAAQNLTTRRQDSPMKGQSGRTEQNQVQGKSPSILRRSLSLDTEEPGSWVLDKSGTKRFHLYESIDESSESSKKSSMKSPTTTSNSGSRQVQFSAGDPEIKQFYRELRPGFQAQQEPLVKQPGTFPCESLGSSQQRPRNFPNQFPVRSNSPASYPRHPGSLPNQSPGSAKKASGSLPSQAPRLQGNLQKQVESTQSQSEPGPKKHPDLRPKFGYVNLNSNAPRFTNARQDLEKEEDSNMDRTREWVKASQESLNYLKKSPALPPKPVAFPEQSPQSGIVYGYENILPISQKFKHDPYSMLSSATGTETVTSMTSSDCEESDIYNDQQSEVRQTKSSTSALLKKAIARNTVVERPGEADNIRKRLALSETSI